MQPERWLGTVVSLRGYPPLPIPTPPPRPKDVDACEVQPEHVLRSTRPIRRAPPAAADPDDLAAAEEEREQKRVRAAAARPQEAHQLSLDAIAALALYEAAAISPGRPAGELGEARRNLIGEIEDLARDLARFKRCFQQLWDERRALEEALGRLVPQGRMPEAVVERLRGTEVHRGSA